MRVPAKTELPCCEERGDSPALPVRARYANELAIEKDPLCQCRVRQSLLET